MMKGLKNTASLLRIVRVLARHNALFVFEPLRTYPFIRRLGGLMARPVRGSRHQRPGERLAAALVELGPSFIKLGQVLSTRADLIGDAFARDLALLQDKLPPFPFEEAKRIIEQELDLPLGALFETFEETPVAAASMAQVHFATTTDGQEVAVKILRPDVAQRFERDMALFGWLAAVLERTLPDMRRLRPREMVETLRQSVEMELDLRYEAAAAVELRENMRGEEGFYVPAIDWQRTASRVLTLERIYGIPGNDIAAVRAAGHDMDAILTAAANAFFVQVFRDGFFHADMHPGNIFIMHDGRIAVVDFGIMGRLDYKNRVFLAQVLSGFLQEDYYMVAKVHAELGIIPPHKSVDQFAMACMAIGKPILGKSISEISVARLLSQLFRVSEAFEMRLQPQLLLLQKTLMLAEGIGRSLNPSLNMWKLSEPMIMAWYRQNLSKPAMAAARAGEVMAQLHRLPEVLESFYDALAQLREGKLVLDPATLEALGGNRKRTRLMSWLAIACVGALAAVLWLRVIVP